MKQNEKWKEKIIIWKNVKVWFFPTMCALCTHVMQFDNTAIQIEYIIYKSIKYLFALWGWLALLAKLVSEQNLCKFNKKTNHSKMQITKFSHI